MKTLTEILKYLAVYFLLLAGPATVTTIVLAVGHKIGGDTMDFDIWDSPLMIPAITVGTTLCIIVFLWRRWAVVNLGRIRRDDVVMMTVMAIAAFVGWFFPEDLLQRFLAVPDNISDKEFEQLTGGIVGLIDTAVLAPVAEELLCRGAILGALLAVMPRRPWVAITVSALIFGVIHMNPVQMVFGGLYGLLLGWIAWRTGSLLPGIIIHVVNNTVAMLMPERVDDAIGSMSYAAEAALAVAGTALLAVALRWFATHYSRPDYLTVLEDNEAKEQEK